jgi:hypothetical protein
MQFEDRASENLKDRYLSLIKCIRDEKLADKCTIPFVPYVGASYCDAKPKILIIGKATYGWGKGEEAQVTRALQRCNEASWKANRKPALYARRVNQSLCQL